MYKLIMVAIALLFSACSQTTFNGQMCDKIVKDPQAIIPQECVAYIEEEAAKASLDQEEQVTPKESIEVKKK